MMYHLLLLLPLLLSTANGAVVNPPAGTTEWMGLSPVPAPTDEVWMNTANSTLTISSSAATSSSTVAEIDKLIVARHVLNAHLLIHGGSLHVGGFGGTGQDFIFVGQYPDATGAVSMDAGRIKVNGELAVAVSGGGTWTSTGDWSV